MIQDEVDYVEKYSQAAANYACPYKYIPNETPKKLKDLLKQQFLKELHELKTINAKKPENERLPDLFVVEQAFNPIDSSPLTFEELVAEVLSKTGQELQEKCVKCKIGKVFQCEKQTRSADESASVFKLCLNKTRKYVQKIR